MIASSIEKHQVPFLPVPYSLSEWFYNLMSFLYSYLIFFFFGPGLGFIFSIIFLNPYFRYTIKMKLLAFSIWCIFQDCDNGLLFLTFNVLIILIHKSTFKNRKIDQLWFSVRDSVWDMWLLEGKDCEISWVFFCKPGVFYLLRWRNIYAVKSKTGPVRSKILCFICTVFMLFFFFF